MKFFIFCYLLSLLSNGIFTAGFTVKESSNVNKYCSSDTKHEFRNTTSKELKISHFNSLLYPEKTFIEDGEFVQRFLRNNQ